MSSATGALRASDFPNGLTRFFDLPVVSPIIPDSNLTPQEGNCNSRLFVIRGKGSFLCDRTSKLLWSKHPVALDFIFAPGLM